MTNLERLTDLALDELMTLRLQNLTQARVKEYAIVNNKFCLGDLVRVSRFPDKIYQVLNIRQLADDLEPHYCLEEPVIWVSESSLELAVQRSCFDCKYIVEQDEPDTWLRVGEKEYYCDNEKAVFDGYVETLDPDCMEDYPDTCTQFCSKAIADEGAKV